MKRPYRSPIEIPKLVKDYLKDKTFCEIGCAEGDLLIEFAKYAKKAIGIERDGQYFHELERKGLDVIVGDIFNMKIPKCDVYYFWITEETDVQIIDILPPSILMTHVAFYDQDRENNYFIKQCKKHPGEILDIIDFQSDENVEWPFVRENLPTKDTILSIILFQKTAP